MSLVLLAHACSHLQNASKARLGLTSLPSTTQLHTLLLQLQKSGYVNTVVIGGPTPPPPGALAPTMSANPEARKEIGGGHVAFWGGGDGDGDGEGLGGGLGEVGVGRDEEDDVIEPITQENVSSRRLWVGLKYYNSRPVLEKMRLVSKPTRRVWVSVKDIAALVKGERRGYVNGLRGIGESMFVTTDRGIMEARECVERRIGGMLLCRVNPVSW